MFVVAEDFNRLPFNISGLNDLSPNVFDDFVSYHEEEQLRKLFGNLFYDSFVDGLVGLPGEYASGTYAIDQLVVYVDGNVADIYKSLANSNTALPTDASKWEKQPLNRWVRLKFGDEYLYYNRPQKWYGMKRLVVPLIYSLWIKWTYDNQTANGLVVTANENSTTVSPANRIARAWNKYAELCAKDFPNVVNPDYLVWPELENSLFGYLYLNSDRFDDLVVNYSGFNTFRAYLAYSFQYPGKTNVFGI